MVNLLLALLFYQFYTGNLQLVQSIDRDSLWSVEYELLTSGASSPLLELSKYWEVYLMGKASSLTPGEVTGKSIEDFLEAAGASTEEVALFNIIVRKFREGYYPDIELKRFKKLFPGSILNQFIKLQEALFNVNRGDTLIAIQILKDLLNSGGKVHIIKQALLWTGKLSILTGNYRDGAYYFSRYAHLFPEDPITRDLNLILLVLTVRNRDFQTALSIVTGGKFRKSDIPLVNLIHGYIELLRGNIDVAEELIKGAKNLDEKAVPLKIYLLGLIDYKKGETDSAISLMDSILKTNAVFLHPYAKFLKILSLKKANKYSEFIRLLKEFPSSGSFLSAYALYLMGLESFKNNQLDSALVYFEKAQRLSQELPIKPQVYFMLGEVSFLLKKYESAINYFSVAQDGLKENDLKGYVSLRIVMCLYYLGKYDDLIAFSEEVLPVVPDSIGEWIHLYRAKTYFKMKLYRYTEDELVKIIRSRAFGDVLYYAYFERGLLKYWLRKYVKAEKYFYQVISNYSDTSRIYRLSFLYIGDCKFNRRQYGLAARYYEKFLELHQHKDELYYDALWHLGLTYYRMRKFSRALKLFESVHRASEKKKVRDVALLMMAECYRSLENYEKAAEIYEKIYQDKKSSLRALAYYKLGDLYYNQGMYENAYEAYKKIIEEFPGSDLVDDAIEGFLQSAGQIGRDQEAYAFFDSLIYSSPPVVAATLLFKKGEYQFNQGWYEEAIKTFAEITSKYPSQRLIHRSYFWMGMAYIRLDSCGKAINAFSKALKIPESYYYIGQCDFKMGNYSGAVENMLRFLEKTKVETAKYPEAYKVLAYSYINLGDTLAADSMMNKILERYPDNPVADEARLYIASRLKEQALYDSALALLKVVKQNRSDDIAAKASLLMADIYRDMGETQEAIIEYITTYRIYEKLFPEIAQEALLRAGELYEKEGRLEEALTVYRRLLRKFPDSPYKEEVEKRAKEIEDKLIEQKLKEKPKEGQQ